MVESAQGVIEKTLRELPQEIKIHAERVPLSLETHPSPEMQEEGIVEDTLGLFVGESFEDVGAGSSPMPGQILLFLDNIWAFADGDLSTFKEEVRITLLHELGHYFGWDEKDLFDRDLD